MPRTNVVGTTVAAGSGAQRCAQAGERKHRTDSTTGTAVTNGGQSPERRGKGRATNAKLPRYVVVLTPARGVDDGVKRLRHLLKVASRSLGLVVISCREEEAEPAPPPTAQF
jgi:hypothetical protein